MNNTSQSAGRSTLPSVISSKECVDTGMALVLICLIAGLATGEHSFYLAAIVLLIINMIWAKIYYYPAKLWLGFSALLGSIMSKVILTVIFFLVQTPVALLRRFTGHDPMLQKQWKKESETVFVTRNHTFTAEELERPY